MQDDRDFRESLSPNSDINDLIDWFERDDVLNIVGHIGIREEDSSHWETFYFDINDQDGEESRITIDADDIPEGFSWEDFFDYLEYLSDENEVDYVNPYGE